MRQQDAYYSRRRYRLLSIFSAAVSDRLETSVRNHLNCHSSKWSCGWAADIAHSDDPDHGIGLILISQNFTRSAERRA